MVSAVPPNRHIAADWVIQYSFGVLSLVGLTRAVMVLVHGGTARVPADRVA